MTRHLTTRETAQRFPGIESSHIRALFKKGDLPEPETFGGKRAIPEDMLPKIEAALRQRGWLTDAVEQGAAAT